MFSIGDKVAFEDNGKDYIGVIDSTVLCEGEIEYSVFVNAEIIDSATGEILKNVHALLTANQLHLIH